MLMNVHQAKTHFSRLLLAVAAGEEVIIAKAGKPVAKLIACESPSPKRIPGRDRNIQIPDDFNDPLPPEILKGFYS